MASDRPLRVLFIAPYVPSLLRVRPYQLVRQLHGRGHAVTVVAPRLVPEDDAAAAALRAEGVRVHAVPFRPWQPFWNCARALPTSLPLQAAYCYAPAMERAIAAEMGDDGRRPRAYDLIHVEHLRAARFGIEPRGVPAVFDAVDCITRLFELAAHFSASRRSRLLAQFDVERTRRFEAELVRRYRYVTTVSQADRDALASLGANGSPRRKLAEITVVPNGVDLEYFRPSEAARARQSLVFVGRLSYHANVTAACTMIRDIMPRIWAARPEAELRIVGAAPTWRLRRAAAAAGPRVTLVGMVPDVRPYLTQAAVSVSPLLYAAGMQNKILEAMATGTAVVTTSAGAAPLEAKDGTELFVARDSAQFAARVLRLIDDPALRDKVGQAGRRFVEQHHDWRQSVDVLESVYRRAIAAPAG